MLPTILFVIFITVYAEQCEDFDASLCDLMMNREPNVCGDPCLSKYCKRSCGLCALQCYTCIDETDITNCTTLTTCQNTNDYCFAAQTFTAHFTEAYRLGCGDRKTCLQYASLSNKRVNVEAGCCNKDKCNNQPPALLKILPEPHYNPIPTMDPSICVNLDNDICTRLAVLLQYPCTDDCIASKLCPHMCKKCFYCLDCHEVSHPDNCTQTTACKDGKRCYGFEKLGSDFLPAVQLGCFEEKLCQTLQSSSGHIFGKRDFSFGGICCIGDKCNAHPLSATTTPIPTTPKQCVHSQGACPSEFVTHGGNCFLFSGRTEMNRSAAEKYCKDHCAEMVYFHSLNDIALFNVFVVSRYEVFTDMVKEHNQWIWSHDRSLVPTSLLTNLMANSGLSTCATARFTFDTFHKLSVSSIQPVPCENLHQALCVIKNN